MKRRQRHRQSLDPRGSWMLASIVGVPTRR
jgi:hypothetical protein